MVVCYVCFCLILYIIFLFFCSCIRIVMFMYSYCYVCSVLCILFYCVVAVNKYIISYITFPPGLM